MSVGATYLLSMPETLDSTCWQLLNQEGSPIISSIVHRYHPPLRATGDIRRDDLGKYDTNYRVLYVAYLALRGYQPGDMQT